MKASLSDFIAGIKQLQRFLTMTEHEADLIGRLNARAAQLPQPEAALVQDVVSSATSSRQYIYLVAIVGLYGIFERFVRSAVNDYVDEASRISGSFDRLPEELKNNHLSASLKLTEGLLRDKFRTETSSDQVIANLYSCRPGSTDFRLNSLAFSFHRGNITFGTLRTILGTIGISLHPRRVINTTAFSAYILDVSPERDLQCLADQELEPLIAPLEDLVERRNSASHGAAHMDSIESIPLLLDRSRFLEAFGRSVYEIMTNELNRHEVIAGIATKIGEPIAVFRNGVVGLRLTGDIAIGDKIFAFGNSAYESPAFGTVLSLHVNKRSVDRLEQATDIEVGMLADFKPFSRRSYYRSTSNAW